MVTKEKKGYEMNDLKLEIIKEATKTIAKHYNTNEDEVLFAIANGNEKIAKELNTLCEKTLEALFE